MKKGKFRLLPTMPPKPSRAKMSSSDAGGKIDLLEPPESVAKKVMAAYCEPGVVENNRVLLFFKTAIFPVVDIKQAEGVALPSGEVFASYASLEAAYAEGRVHPRDLKLALADSINALLAPLQEKLEELPGFKELAEAAYPVL